MYIEVTLGMGKMSKLLNVRFIKSTNLSLEFIIFFYPKRYTSKLAGICEVEPINSCQLSLRYLDGIQSLISKIDRKVLRCFNVYSVIEVEMRKM